jgi:Holliday junction resolvase-like predicted endonuclease
MNAEELNENQVVQFVSEHLEKDGWTIQQALTAHQPGIDLVAKRGSETLYVEAKGTGTRESRPHY